MKKTVIVSDYNKNIINELNCLGYDVICFSGVKDFSSFLKYHTDLFFSYVGNKLFVSDSVDKTILEETKKICHTETAEKIIEGYPYETAMNCFEIGEYLVCSLKSVSVVILQYAKQIGKEIIPVKQGYAKCACAVAGANSVITEDPGIARVLTKYGVDVLLIGAGGVTLEGYNYGFIGGASFFDKERKTVYFFGNVTKHPEYKKINDFCKRHGTKIRILDSEILLTDLGSAVILKDL